MFWQVWRVRSTAAGRLWITHLLANLQTVDTGSLRAQICLQAPAPGGVVHWGNGKRLSQRRTAGATRLVALTTRRTGVLGHVGGEQASVA